MKHILKEYNDIRSLMESREGRPKIKMKRESSQA